MTAYKFATDSESGTIEAASFDEARGILDAMVTDTVGGFGWVEDTDGFRYDYEDNEHSEIWFEGKHVGDIKPNTRRTP